MKKLISSLLAGCMLTLSLTSVYAENITTVGIEAATYNKDTKKVEVTANITNPAAESQIITVMSVGAPSASDTPDSSISEDTIVHIDQIDNPTIEEGKINLQFYLKDGTVDENDSIASDKKYFVRIGGSGIDTPGFLVIEFTNENPDPIVFYGDVNGDNVIDVNDASLLLDYVLNPKDVTVSEDEKGAVHLKRAKVRGGENQESITAEDVAMILKRALTKGTEDEFKFPIEYTQTEE